MAEADGYELDGVEVGRGAEAVLYKQADGSLLKHRLRKKYRISKIDDRLRKSRTRREANILKKLGGQQAPVLINTDGEERIVMQFISGKLVKDVLDSRPVLAREIGAAVAGLHEKDIVHSDLTTSNMILHNNVSDGGLCLIDFGLSYHSTRVEDKAVDIHLFLQALESRHHRVLEKAYSYFLEGYKHYDTYEEVLKRLDVVRKRGRNKQK